MTREELCAACFKLAQEARPTSEASYVLLMTMCGVIEDNLELVLADEVHAFVKNVLIPMKEGRHMQWNVNKNLN